MEQKKIYQQKEGARGMIIFIDNETLTEEEQQIEREDRNGNQDKGL